MKRKEAVSHRLHSIESNAEVHGALNGISEASEANPETPLTIAISRRSCKDLDLGHEPEFGLTLTLLSSPELISTGWFGIHSIAETARS